MSAQPVLVSIVIPVYCSEPILPETHRRLGEVLSALAPEYDYEIVFVNDGSSDGSMSVLKSIAEKDPRVRALDLSRNFGHQIALSAGIDHAMGDVVVVIDDDLQDPPEVIPQMLEKWREGYKVVYGVRTRREGENAFKRWTASAFYRMLKWMSDVDIPVDSGDFRLMDRAVVDALKSMREETRYVRGMVAWIGFKQCALPYEREARFAGTGNYTMGRLIKFALDGILSFSSRPLALSAQFGMIVTLVAFLSTVYLVVLKLAYPDRIVAGWTSVLVAVLFMGGVQLISIGVLGSYLGRVFYETKHRPLYFVAERHGFADDDEHSFIGPGKVGS
jgi:polyisoprenyl-phosphate glycosyltransferase